MTSMSPLLLPVAIGHKSKPADRQNPETHLYILTIIPLTLAAFSLSDVPFEDKQAIILYTMLISYSLASRHPDRLKP